jgi:hypothetical protein
VNDVELVIAGKFREHSMDEYYQVLADRAGRENSARSSGLINIQDPMEAGPFVSKVGLGKLYPDFGGVQVQFVSKTAGPAEACRLLQIATSNHTDGTLDESVEPTVEELPGLPMTDPNQYSWADAPGNNLGNSPGSFSTSKSRSSGYFTCVWSTGTTCAYEKVCVIWGLEVTVHSSTHVTIDVAHHWTIHGDAAKPVSKRNKMGFRKE